MEADNPTGQEHQENEYVLVEESSAPDAPASKGTGSLEEHNGCQGNMGGDEGSHGESVRSEDTHEDEGLDSDKNEMEQDDKHEMEQDRCDEALGQSSKNLHDIVNDALESKLQSFQVQMQQMLSMIQNATSVKAKPQKLEGNVQDPEKLGTASDAAEESSAQQQAKRKEAQFEKRQKKRAEQELQQKKFNEFLVSISPVLNLPIQPEGTGPQDETTESSQKPTPISFPAEELVKKSWEKVEGKHLHDTLTLVKIGRKNYPWSSEDVASYGEIPLVNEKMVTHLNHVNEDEGIKSYNGLPLDVSKVDKELQLIESLLRYQQRIFSYTSYFLRALIEGSKEGSPLEGGTILEVQNYLARSLSDACDTSVQGCVATTRARRRIYVNTMQVPHPTCTKGHYQVVNAPFSKELFSPDMEDTFKKHKIELNCSPRKRKSDQTRGKVGQGKFNSTTKRLRFQGQSVDGYGNPRNPQMNRLMDSFGGYPTGPGMQRSFLGSDTLSKDDPFV